MRKDVLLLVLILLFTSCKNGQKSNQAYGSNAADTICASETPQGPFTIHIDDLSVPLYDTLRLGELVESVRYIPLETTIESTLGLIRDIHYNNGCFYVTYGENMMNTRLKAFDKEGKYIREMYTIGRGPNEIVNPLPRMVYNDSKNQILVQSYGEFLIVDETIHNNKKIRFESSPTPGSTASLENGSYVCTPLLYDHLPDQVEKGTYLIFYDSIFNVTGFIADDKEHKIKEIEGRTSGPILRSWLTQSGGKVLYKDMNSDTIYVVNSDMTLTPEIIIEIPDKLKPTIRESKNDSSEKKQSKIYIWEYYETKDYIIISYEFQGGLFTGFWSKAKGELVYRSFNPYDGNVINYSDTHIHGKLYKLYDIKASSNSLKILVYPLSLKNVIPGIKDDDNPVIVEFTLQPGKK